MPIAQQDNQNLEIVDDQLTRMKEEDKKEAKSFSSVSTIKPYEISKSRSDEKDPLGKPPFKLIKRLLCFVLLFLLCFIPSVQETPGHLEIRETIAILNQENDCSDESSDEMNLSSPAQNIDLNGLK